MAKSRSAKGKEPVKTSCTPRSGLVDDNSRNRLVRQAQAQVKNRGSKRLIPDDELDEDKSSNEGLQSEGKTDFDDEIDPAAHEDLSDGDEQSADENSKSHHILLNVMITTRPTVSIQEEESLLLARLASLQQRKQVESVPRPSHSARPPANARPRAPAAASVGTPLPAPGPVPTPGPVPAPTPVPASAPAPAPVPALAPAPASNTPGPKKPSPLVWGGGQDWIPLPDRKADQNVEKIREGLGAQHDRPGWLKVTVCTSCLLFVSS